jgi:predicted PurR-regulated permease PerM
MIKFKKSDTSKVEITISNRTVVRVLLLVVLSMIGLAAFKQASHALVLIFVSVFLALALNAPVHWIASRLPGKRRGSRSMATGISFLIVLAVLVGFLASIVPPIVKQTDNFIAAAPGLIHNLRDQNGTVNKFIIKYNLQSQVDSLSTQATERLKNVSGTAVSTLSSIGSSLFSTLTVLALTFMMLIEGPLWVALARNLLPKEKRSHADVLARDMYKVVKGYVNGQVTLAALAALLIVPAMFILHISNPIALMVIVFICGLIPMIGHTIGALIVTTVALFHSPVSAVAILAYYILYQQIENYVVQPKIQANSTNMSPLLVFMAVVVGVSFGGLLGGLVAIPVMGCIRIVTVDYLKIRERNLPVES